MIGKYLSVFLVSMVPLVELRLAVPIAIGMGLDYFRPSSCACWEICCRFRSSTSLQEKS